MSPWQQALTFILDTVFSLTLFILLLRFFLQWVNAAKTNPITQTIFKIAQPLIWPFEKICPQWRRVSLATLIAVCVVELIKITSLYSLNLFHLPHWDGLLLWSAGDIIENVCHLFFFVIIGRVILSWIRPQQYNPALSLIYSLSDLILGPFERVIPTIGGIQLAPIPALILLQMIQIFIATPLLQRGLGMA